MKKLVILLSIVLGLVKINAQSFVGTVDFKYFTQKDTFNNVYVVKDGIVKLDQFTKKTNVIEGSFIFNLKNNTIKFVNPKRKVWGDHKSETPPVIRGQCEVTKGNGSKTIVGSKCKEFIVKNVEENTIITYWIADAKLDFFIPMIKLWNRKDRQSIYFSQIKDLPAGSMPMLSEEKLLSDGKLITKLEVTKISAKVPEQWRLEVPSEYSKFEQ